MSDWVEPLLQDWTTEHDRLAGVMGRYPSPERLWDTSDVDAGPAIAWLAGRLAATPILRRRIALVVRRCLDAVRDRGERAPAWRVAELCDDFGPIFAGTRMHTSARALVGFAQGCTALMRANELIDDFGPAGRSFPDRIRGAFEGATDAWQALATLEEDPRTSTGFERLLRNELTLRASGHSLVLVLQPGKELGSDD